MEREDFLASLLEGAKAAAGVERRTANTAEKDKFRDIILGRRVLEAIQYW
jgi:hypothetical protein